MTDTTQERNHRTILPSPISPSLSHTRGIYFSVLTSLPSLLSHSIRHPNFIYINARGKDYLKLIQRLLYHYEHILTGIGQRQKDKKEDRRMTFKANNTIRTTTKFIKHKVSTHGSMRYTSVTSVSKYRMQDQRSKIKIRFKQASGNETLIPFGINMQHILATRSSESSVTSLLV